MLSTYLQRRAFSLLDDRARTVSQISGASDAAARKQYIRARILDSLGGLPERTPLNARVTGTVERDDYRIEKIVFESQPKFYVTANLYLPKRGRGPYPAILFPLGHEAGGKANEAWQHALVSFAKKGYVALAWDPLGQGERVQLWDPDTQQAKVIRSTTEHSILGVQCLLTGDNIARYTVWDGIRALDYLLSRPEVDAAKVGCTGNSGGGTHTAYLSALEDRIHVAAPSCYITSWRRLLESIGPQDAEQVLLPFLADGLDHPDFIYAFAPRPYLMLSAIRDFFSISGARESYDEARGLYARLNAEDRMSMFEADDGHGYSKPRRLAAYRWFARWLKNASDEDPEPEVTIATEEELHATKTGQVSSSFEVETVFSLNRARLAALKRPQLSREDLRLELRRLTGFEPPAGAVPVRFYGRIQRSGYVIEKLVYESEPGILVPSLLFLPEPAGERRPAILYAHGRGKSVDARPGGEIEELVRKGFIVFAVDYRGIGETSATDTRGGSDFPRYFGDYGNAMTSLLVGKTLVGMRAQDLYRALDVLATRQEVDAAKITAIAKETATVPMLHLAALDGRINRLALESGLVSYESVVRNNIHMNVFENVVPKALKTYDLPDLIVAVAPRPVWLIDPVNPMGRLLPVNEVQMPSAQILRRPPYSGIAVYSAFLKP